MTPKLKRLVESEAELREYPDKELRNMLEARREYEACVYGSQFMHDHLMKTIDELMGALETVIGPHEVDWADKARLRDFIRNQEKTAKRATEKARRDLGLI